MTLEFSNRETGKTGTYEEPVIQPIRDQYSNRLPCMRSLFFRNKHSLLAFKSNLASFVPISNII
jgi:hypothetical protein